MSHSSSSEEGGSKEPQSQSEFHGAHIPSNDGRMRAVKPPAQAIDRVKLRSIIQGHLRTEKVYDKIQEYVAEVMSEAAEKGDGKPVDEGQVMKALEERGIISDVVHSLTKATDLASATGAPRTGGFLDLLSTPERQDDMGGTATVGASLLAGGEHGGWNEAGVAGVVQRREIQEEGRRFLHLRVVAGRAFVEMLEDGQDGVGASTLHVHAQYLHQRFRCGPVPVAVNPRFDGSFIIDVQKEGMSGLADATALLTSPDPIHLVVTRTFENGRRALVGTAKFQWRKVLQTGYLSASVRVIGSGVEANHVPVGLLELRAQLVPQLEKQGKGEKDQVGAARIEAQLEYETTRRQEAERLFFSYAKQWWRDYLGAREEHAERLVKIYAQTESGVSCVREKEWNEECVTQENVPVCAFVRPLRAPGLLDTPRHAARFVSLLAFEREESMRGTGTGARSETWHLPHTFLSVGAGDCEDHATLLCSLLLGFHLDAYVCIGTDDRGPHVWVLMRVGNGADGRCVFWESLTGARFAHPISAKVEDSRRHKYETIGCVFNHKAFYANCQPTDVVSALSFQFENPAHWKPMTTEALAVLRRPPAITFAPFSGNVAALEHRIATELAQKIADQRGALGLRTQWDPELGHMLTSAIAAYELERVTGVVVGNEEFQLAVRRTVAEGNTFKAFPIQFNHTDSSRMMRSMGRSRVCRDVVETQGDRVRFGLRVRAYPYAENALALWVMLAVKYCWVG